MASKLPTKLTQNPTKIRSRKKQTKREPQEALWPPECAHGTLFAAPRSVLLPKRNPKGMPGASFPKKGKSQFYIIIIKGNVAWASKTRHRKPCERPPAPKRQPEVSFCRPGPSPGTSRRRRVRKSAPRASKNVPEGTQSLF